MEAKELRFFQYVRPGDIVDNDIVEDISDWATPSFYSGYFRQIGEATGTRLNPVTNQMENTYLTFARIGDNQWLYYGSCLLGELKLEEPATEWG